MKKIYSIIFLISCLFPLSSYASHIMGGDLIYQHLGGNQYRIKLTQYRDCSGIIPSSSATISITSATCSQSYTVTANLETGYPIEVSAICPAQIANTTCNGGTSIPGVQEYVYSVTTTLPANCTDWVFSWWDGNRNSGINTISLPGNAYIYLEATLNNLTFAGNNSPDFTTKPVPYFGLNQPQNYSHATIEPDGDVLVYSLVAPLDINATTPVTFLSPYTATYPISTTTGTFPFNTATGQMSFTPNTVQQAVTAILVQEYRGGVLIGSVRRDIQMVVLSGSNGSTVAATPSSISGANLVAGQTSVFNACVGTPMTFQISASDPNPATVIVHTSTNNVVIPASSLTSSGTNPKTLTFSWTPTAADIGTNSFSVSFTDNNCPIPSLIGLNYVIYVLGINVTNTDTIVCTLGNSIQLGTSIFGSGTGGYTWTGQGLSANNIANPIATPTSLPATYTVNYNLLGCNATDNVTLIPGTISANAFTNDSVVCMSKPISLNATINGPSGGTNLWTGNGLSANNIINPMATPPTLPQSYTFTYTSPSGGCTATDVVTVTQSNVLATAAVSSPSNICIGGGPIQLTASPTPPSSTTYNLTSIPFSPVSGTGTSLTLSDDQVSAALPIGFSFNFFGNTYTNFYISSNGFITFDATSGSGCCSGQVLPNISSPNNLIALNWDDMYPPAGGTIEYFTTGTAPNRRLIVNYTMINPCCSANAATDMTGQIVLYENTNYIEIHASDIGASGGQTMGIEDAAGTSAVVVSGRSSTTWSAVNEGWRFSPGLSYTYAWSPATNLSSTSIYNPIISTLTADTVYNVTITSSEGCTGTSTVTIHTNTPFAASVTAAASPTSICAGSSTSIQLNATPVSVPSYTGNGPYTVSAIAHAPISGAGTNVTLGDDQLSTALPIGFSFTFYGNTYTNFYISSNGFITFDGASSTGCCSGGVIPNSISPNDMIALTWNDLYPPAGGTISYFTTGTAPNRQLIVNYDAINHCCAAGPNNTGQIVLYEGTNIIDIFATNITNDGSTCTLGVENAAGTAATSPAGRNGAVWTATNEGWRFVSGTTGTHTYSWSPSTNLSSTTIYNPVVSSLAATTTYNVQVTELATGCTVTKPITVTVNAPITPSIAQTPYCNSASLAVSNPYTGTIQWYNNNTATGSPVGTGSPFSTSTNGTYYAFETLNGCLGAVSNASTVNVGMSNLWNHIPTPTPPVASTQSYYADNYCFDPVSGLNYFYHAGTQTLILATDYAIPTGVNLVAYPPSLTTEMAVRTDVLPGYGSGLGEFVAYGNAPYVTNPNGWYLMHRTWQVSVHPNNQIPSGSKKIRFYFDAVDVSDVTIPTGHVLDSLWFYKMVTGLNPSNPANHAGVTTPQIHLYTRGASATTSNWTLGNAPSLSAFYADYAVTSFSGGGGGSGMLFQGPLPVALVGFYGEKNGNQHFLHWQVNQEVGTTYYEIERSLDDKHYAPIGKLAAMGFTQYQYIDQNPLIGNNYYRLKMIDIDGKYEYSQTVQLGYFPNGFQFSLSPNPASSLVNIELEGLVGGDVKFSLYNELGQEVLFANWNEIGNLRKTLDISALPNGIYLYKISDSNTLTNYKGKLIKQ